MKVSLIMWYENVSKYIKEHFDFSENKHLSIASIFSLEKSFSFGEVTDFCRKMKLTDRLDMDKLYDDYYILKDSINKMIEVKKRSKR